MNRFQQPRRRFLQFGAARSFTAFFASLSKISFAQSASDNSKGIVVHEVIMKKILSLLVPTIFLAFTHHVSLAQQNNETEIRNLEKMEGEAFVKKDTAALFHLFSPQLVVNTPLNRVATLEDIKRLLRIGKIDLTSSGKNIEKITFINNMAVVMGQDIIKPQGVMEGAGKIVTRRYTDVWIKEESGWKLTVRQATNIPAM